MNCRKAHKAMQLQLDGELPDRWRTGFVHHLRTCGACRRVQEQTALIGGALDELSAATSVRSAARLLITAPHRPSRWRIPATIAAAIILVMAFWSIPYLMSPEVQLTQLLASAFTHTAHVPSGAHGNAGATRTLGTAPWSEADYWTRVTVTLLVLGVAAVVYQARKKPHAPPAG
jgi:predicted anti-sigma-YlaC factor YlaD